MDTSPLRVTFKFDGDLDEEIKKVTLNLKGFGWESASSFKRLLNASKETFANMSEGSKQLATSIQGDLLALRQLRAAMAALEEAYKKGDIGADNYAQAGARLSAQETELTESIKRQAAAQKEEEAAMARGAGSIAEKRAELGKLQTEYANLAAAEREGARGEELRNSIKSLKDELDELSGATKSAKEQQEDLLKTAKTVPGPLSGIAKSIQAAVTAAKAFIATPLGACLTLISLALAAVSSWFKRTVEGQSALRVASAALNQVLNSLLDIVDNVGKTLYKAFTEPKKALSELGDFIITNLLNRIQAIVDIGKAVGKMFDGDFKGGTYDLGNALTKLTTGVDNAVGKMIDGMDTLIDKTKQAAQLADDRNKLGLARRQWITEEAALEAKISEYREKASDNTRNEKERLSYVEKAKILTDQKYAKEIAFAEEEARITAAEKALSHSNKEDLREVAEKQAEIERLKGQRATAMRGLNRQGNMLRNKIENDADSWSENQAILAAQRKVVNEQIRLQQEAEARRIEVMKDGHAKRLAQINLDYEKEKQTIKEKAEELLTTLQQEERKKWEESSSRTPFVQTVTTLPAEVQASIDNANNANEDNRVARTTKANEDLLKQFEDYAAKRTRIEEEFNADIQALINQRTAANTQETDRAIAEATRRKNAEIAGLDDEYAKVTNAIGKLFKDLSSNSVKELQAIADEAEKMVTFVLAGDYDAEQGALFGLTEAQFRALNAEWAKSPELIEAVRKAIANLRTEASAASNAFKKVGDGFKKIFSAGSDPAALAVGLSLVTDGAQQLSAAVKFLSDNFAAMGEAMHNDTLSDVAETLSGISEATDAAMQGMQAGAMFGPAGAAVGAAVGLGINLTKQFSEAKAARDKLKNQIAENQRAEIIGEKDINRLYRERYEWAQKIGEATLEYIRRQGEELKKQTKSNASDYDTLFAEMQNQSYKTGEHFKSTGLFGWGHGKIVTEWASLAGKSYEEIEALAERGKLSEEGEKFFQALKAAKEEGEDIEQRQIEYLEKLRETTVGSTYQGVVDGIVQGFRDGKRSAADFAETFDNLMQGAVNSALSLLADERMRKWYEDFAKAGEDGYTEEEIAQGRATYLATVEGIAADAKRLEEVTGVPLAGQVQATQKGIASMSQESADELNGRFTTMLIYQDKMNHNLTDIRSAVLEGLGHLAAIEHNTSYCRGLEGMGADIAGMHANIATMAKNGARI
jgi:hypothetical protein